MKWEAVEQTLVWKLLVNEYAARAMKRDICDFVELILPIFADTPTQNPRIGSGGKSNQDAIGDYYYPEAIAGLSNLLLSIILNDGYVRKRERGKRLRSSLSSSSAITEERFRKMVMMVLALPITSDIDRLCMGVCGIWVARYPDVMIKLYESFFDLKSSVSADSINNNNSQNQKHYPRQLYHLLCALLFLSKRKVNSKNLRFYSLLCKNTSLVDSISQLLKIENKEKKYQVICGGGIGFPMFMCILDWLCDSI